MESHKEDRFKSILTEIVSAFIREEANDNPLITVTNLTVSQKSKEATVYVTTIPDSGQEEALIFLKRKGTELRQYVKKHGRFKFIPHFNFEIDYGERHRQHIDEISQEIRNKKDV